MKTQVSLCERLGLVLGIVKPVTPDALLSDPEEHLRQENIATKVLTLQLISERKSILCPIGFWYTSAYNNSVTQVEILEAAYEHLKQRGLYPIGVVADGLSVNRLTFKSLKFKYTIFCYVHLYKNMRQHLNGGKMRYCLDGEWVDLTLGTIKTAMAQHPADVQYTYIDEESGLEKQGVATWPSKQVVFGEDTQNVPLCNQLFSEDTVRMLTHCMDNKYAPNTKMWKQLSVLRTYIRWGIKFYTTMHSRELDLTPRVQMLEAFVHWLQQWDKCREKWKDEIKDNLKRPEHLRRQDRLAGSAPVIFSREFLDSLTINRDMLGDLHDEHYDPVTGEHPSAPEYHRDLLNTNAIECLFSILKGSANSFTATEVCTLMPKAIVEFIKRVNGSLGYHYYTNEINKVCVNHALFPTRIPLGSLQHTPTPTPQALQLPHHPHSHPHSLSNMYLRFYALLFSEFFLCFQK